MATSNKLAKSRISTKSKKNGFKFHWWMALVLVIIVGGMGVIIVRFSNAAVGSQYDQRITNNSNNFGGWPDPTSPTRSCNFNPYQNKVLATYSAGEFHACGRYYSNNQVRWVRNDFVGGTGHTCAEIQRIGQGPNKTVRYFYIPDQNSSDLDTGKTVRFIERNCAEGHT